MKHSQRGYSLVELSIVLAIIAVVIAGAVTGVQTILRSNNTVRTIATTNKAVGAITAKLMRDADYTNATNANLTNASMGVWDSKDISGTAVTNAYGGQVYVGALSADENGISKLQGYVYTLTGVPTAACVDLVMGIEPLGVTIGVKNELSTATAAAKTTAYGTVVKKPGTALTSSTVVGACAPAADTGYATVTFTVPRS